MESSVLFSRLFREVLLGASANYTFGSVEGKGYICLVLKWELVLLRLGRQFSHAITHEFVQITSQWQMAAST